MRSVIDGLLVLCLVVPTDDDVDRISLWIQLWADARICVECPQIRRAPTYNILLDYANHYGIYDITRAEISDQSYTNIDLEARAKDVLK